MASSALVIPASTTASSWAWLARSAPGGRDCLVEQVGALVDVEERVEDRRVQLFCRQAHCVAVPRAVALAGKAGVVAPQGRWEGAKHSTSGKMGGCEAQL